jgi:hypothetical protein
LPETKELAPRREMKKNAARSEKTSHAGIIRIGFEGISQPHNEWSTPVSIASLKHPTGAVGKFDKKSR